jgi:hypothetical protein
VAANPGCRRPFRPPGGLESPPAGKIACHTIHKDPPQNVILVPSWINLGLFIWLVITPKLEFVTVVFGVPK